MTRYLSDLLHSIVSRKRVKNHVLAPVHVHDRVHLLNVVQLMNLVVQQKLVPLWIWIDSAVKFCLRLSKYASLVCFLANENHCISASRRIVRSGSTASQKPSQTAQDGGTQTLMQRTSGGSIVERGRSPERRHESSTGEVRVIVQPIQPVFYMPRQSRRETIDRLTEKETYL